MFTLLFDKKFKNKKLKIFIGLSSILLLVKAIMLATFMIGGSEAPIVYISVFFNVFMLLAMLIGEPGSKRDTKKFYEDFSSIAVVIGLVMLLGVVTELLNISAKVIEGITAPFFYQIICFLDIASLFIWLKTAYFSREFNENYTGEESESVIDETDETDEDACSSKEGIPNYVDDIFEDLSEEEIDLVKIAILNIMELFYSTYDDKNGIIKAEMFYDIISFLESYKEALSVYKKGRTCGDLSFLEKLNNSAEEFYKNINSNEQDFRREKFENKIEILKIRLSKVLQERKDCMLSIIFSERITTQRK